MTAAEEPAAQLGHERALELLQRRAPDTLALVDRYARALATGRIEVVAVPFDSLSSVRVLISASRAAGVPSLLIQHGYAPEPNDPDKGQADHTAAWAERDAREVRERHGREATVTGNPAAPASVVAAQARGRRPDARAGAEPDRVLRALGRAGQRALRPRRCGRGARPARQSDVVLRPHPLEPSPDAFLRLVPEARSLRRVDVTTPLGELLAECDSCSAASPPPRCRRGWRACHTTFLDVTGGELPEPFRHEGELAQEELAEALGVTGDATRRVLDLIDQLAAASA